MKRATMELGGHAPVIVCEDGDAELAAAQLIKMKPFNAGQTCASPNRILVHERHYDRFIQSVKTGFQAVRLGNGLEQGTQMGPLANVRRLAAMEDLCSDALQTGGRIVTGGKRSGERGYFFPLTVIDEVPETAKVRRIEGFGPVIVVIRFRDLEEAITEANRLPYALAAYAYTRSLSTAKALAQRVECGNLIVNDAVIALPEMPFGGIKESGYGMEGGTEGIDAYLATKLFSYR
jgi:succinate-semialdehyde dehydrogenase/glutarate-semialdehyde dehydrogenase